MAAHGAKGRYLAIDGFRGLGAGSVVVGHWGFTRFSDGAYVFMDSFFVMSGYLITGLLLSLHRRSTTPLRDFYEGRVVRLLPALLVILPLVPIFAAVAGWSRPSCIPLELTRALTFTYNAPVYGAYICEDPFLPHLWSLSIEEQFYLLWAPAVLFLMRLRNGRRWCIALATAALLVGTVAMFVQTSLRPGMPDLPDSYYRTECRIPGLAIGALLALYTTREGHHTPQRSLLRPSLLLAVIVIAAGAASPWTPYAALSLLASATTAALLFATINPSPDLVRDLYCWRPLVLAGSVSYPLYIVHVPIQAVLLSQPWILEHRTLMLPVHLALVLGAAYAVHRWAEQPAARMLRRHRETKSARARRRFTLAPSSS